MKVSEAEHQAFLQDCREMTIYYNYLKHQFKNIDNFDEDELRKYHKVYITLVSSWKGYKGSFLIKHIKDIVSSNKPVENRYAEYKKCIDEQIELYNKAYSSRPNKQIRI